MIHVYLGLLGVRIVVNDAGGYHVEQLVAGPGWVVNDDATTVQMDADAMRHAARTLETLAGKILDVPWTADEIMRREG
jgi:hypothetical protein